MLTVPEAVVKQMSDDPPTEKAASAENRDEPAMVGCAVCEVFCHGHEPATPWHDFSIPGNRTAGISASSRGLPCQRAARIASGLPNRWRGEYPVLPIWENALIGGFHLSPPSSPRKRGPRGNRYDISPTTAMLRAK